MIQILNLLEQRIIIKYYLNLNLIMDKKKYFLLKNYKMILNFKLKINNILKNIKFQKSKNNYKNRKIKLLKIKKLNYYFNLTILVYHNF